MRRLLSAQSDGTYTLRMGQNEREVIQSLLPQMRELITQRDSAAWRLFPNAYQDDAEKAAEYEELVGDDLRKRRLESIAIVEQTIEADTLTEDQIQAWMGAVNDLRLVLGTRLDVTEESEMEDYNTDNSQFLFSAYAYLGMVLEEIISAITGR